MLLLGGSASQWNGDYAAEGCLYPFVSDDGVSHAWLYYGQSCSGMALHSIRQTDKVCNVPCGVPCGCGNTSIYFPKSQWMHADTPRADAAYSESTSRWTWPAAAAAAGSFWRYSPTLSTIERSRRLRAITGWLDHRGVATCPFDADGCPGGCSYTQHCGKTYGLTAGHVVAEP